MKEKYREMWRGKKYKLAYTDCNHGRNVTLHRCTVIPSKHPHSSRVQEEVNDTESTRLNR